jgi:hypothetical protein
LRGLGVLESKYKMPDFVVKGVAIRLLAREKRDCVSPPRVIKNKEPLERKREIYSGGRQTCQF